MKGPVSRQAHRARPKPTGYLGCLLRHSCVTKIHTALAGRVAMAMLVFSWRGTVRRGTFGQSVPQRPKTCDHFVRHLSINLTLISVLLLAPTGMLHAQAYLTIQYYQDSIDFTGKEPNGYDASDVLNTWDDFVRLKVDYPVGESYRITTWIDLNSGLQPQNARIGFGRLLGKRFRVEAMAKYLGYWIPYQDSMPLESSYNHAYSLFALGLSPSYTYQWKRIAFTFEVAYSRAFTARERLDYVDIDRDNFRSLDRYHFKLKNYQSLYGKSQIVLELLKRDKWSLGLLYQLIIRNDYFSFDYDHRRYEWTYSNIVSESDFRVTQSSHGLQHHFGLRVTLAYK